MSLLVSILRTWRNTEICSSYKYIKLSFTINGALFDSTIPEEQLIEIVDRASQLYQQSTQVLVGNGVGEREIGDAVCETIDEGITESASSTVLTQSTTNSSLNAVLSRSFKSVNFERMENCHFNFHFTK